MFTVGAFVLMLVIAKASSRMNNKGLPSPASVYSEEEVMEAVVHSRQDLRLIAFLLGGILIMLGVVADRLH